MMGARRRLLTCPDCGLELVILRTSEELFVRYEFLEWERRCRRGRCDSAGFCLLSSEENLLDAFDVPYSDARDPEPPP